MILFSFTQIYHEHILAISLWNKPVSTLKFPFDHYPYYILIYSIQDMVSFYFMNTNTKIGSGAR